MNYLRYIKLYYILSTRRLAQKLNLSSRILRRALAALMSNYFFNLIFFPIFGYTLLINYMAVNDFFSYEMLSDSYFAVNIFTLAMVAGLLLTTFALFSAPIYAFSDYPKGKKKLKPLSEYWLLLTLNILFLGLFIFLFIYVEDKTFPAFVLSITVYLALHYTVFLFGNFKAKFYSTTALLIISMSGIYFTPDLSAKIFGNGLRVFGAGGVESILYDEVNTKGVKVELLLITPKSVYFKVNGATNFVPLDKVKQLALVKKI